MSTTVKICGIQHSDTIQAIAHLPIDHIGFIFAPSKRRVTAAQAGQWIRLLRSLRDNQAPLAVGVFVNPTQEELVEAMSAAPLDVIQLHGQETPAFCDWVKETFPVLVAKVFSVASEIDEAEIANELEPYKHSIDMILLDTAGGGTGQTFNWNAIPIYQTWTIRNQIKLLIAGGLNPDNVQYVIDRYHPDGVDVSSGVETNGHKDTEKIQTFVERVKDFG